VEQLHSVADYSPHGAAAGADNGADYSTWDREQLRPALAQIPLAKLGAGLGCWIDYRTNGTWNLKPQSAIDRVCLLMNKSVR
jgi:hypothetical protein